MIHRNCNGWMGWALLDLRVAVIAADPLAGAGLMNLLSTEASLMLIGPWPLSGEPSGRPDDPQPEIGLLDPGWGADPMDAAVRRWLDLELPLVLLLSAADGEPLGWLPGSRGLIDRDRPAPVIAAALQAAAAGLLIADPRLVQSPFPTTEGMAPVEDLTARELEVLQLLADGRTNRAIAEALNISEHTVKFHVTSILSKLDAESRTAAAVQAARSGWLIL
jgi:NarL family two-component system response regulator YdfI